MYMQIYMRIRGKLKGDWRVFLKKIFHIFFQNLGTSIENVERACFPENLKFRFSDMSGNA